MLTSHKLLFVIMSPTAVFKTQWVGHHHQQILCISFTRLEVGGAEYGWKQNDWLQAVIVKKKFFLMSCPVNRLRQNSRQPALLISLLLNLCGSDYCFLCAFFTRHKLDFKSPALLIESLWFTTAFDMQEQRDHPLLPMHISKTFLFKHLLIHTD